MKVLGISGKERHAAAAIAENGSIVAAAAEESFARVPHVGYRYTGGYPFAAIDACLTRAGLAVDDLDRIVVVADGRGGPLPDDIHGDADHLVVDPRPDEARRRLRALPVESMNPLAADARQLAAAAGEDDFVAAVLASECAQSAVFVRRGSELLPSQAAGIVQPLHCAVRRVAGALGFAPGRYDLIEDLASASVAAPTDGFEDALRWSGDAVVVDTDRLDGAIERSLPDGGAAADPSLNVRVQQARGALAAAFCARVESVVVEMLDGLAARTAVKRVGVGGSLAASRGIQAAAMRSFGAAFVPAPVPEPFGRALGAALDGQPTAAAALDSLALGPDFSEQEIKTALENCRLDYLYEPDWARLLGRISRMLAQGTVVAWFQGPMGFGPRSVGTRAILCDPSNRYARENINRFLRHGATEDPLPVTMTAAAAAECLEGAGVSPFLLSASTVKSEWRERLRAAVDQRDTVPVQLTTERQAPALYQLLQIHRESAKVPGLINTTLSGGGEPAACTPRDAVRTMYSSAIDALVIGRFLLMKDYWLLRSGAGS